MDQEKNNIAMNLLSMSESEQLIEALKAGQGRSPSEEESNTLIKWALQTRLNQELIDMTLKGVFKIKLVIEDGFLIPRFEITELGEQIRSQMLDINEKLKEEGGDILREMIKDIEKGKENDKY